MKGKFISLDGPDGGGKSTQANLLCEKLRRAGYAVVSTREPGGTDLGERIRRILLDGSSGISLLSEALLYTTARAQLVQEVIGPALSEGQIVVSERFFHASIAYQCYGSGLDRDTVDSLTRIATAGCKPDLTIILDISPEIFLRDRVVGRKLDRIESRGIEYHRRVREGFLALSREHPSRIKVVDAARPVLEVHRAVLNAVRCCFGPFDGGEV